MVSAPIYQATRPSHATVVLLIGLLAATLLMPRAAVAEARSFRMALWGGNDERYTDIEWFYPPNQLPASLPAAQPARRTILDIGSIYQKSDFQSFITQLGYDWSRIAAVVIDEPYYDELSSISCVPFGAVQAKEHVIASAASVLESLAPNTRFWINFSVPELQKMKPPCSLPLNRPYIDVISIDKYDTPFSGLQSHYQWMLDNKPQPDQQLALVPGTFYLDPQHSGHHDYRTAATAAAWLEGYFAYADNVNAGNRNRPVVWLIVGFHSEAVPMSDGVVYRGLTAPGSAPIAEAWAQRRSLAPWPWAAPIVLTLF
jgi:hypothetical protein